MPRLCGSGLDLFDWPCYGLPSTLQSLIGPSIRNASKCSIALFLELTFDAKPSTVEEKLTFNFKHVSKLMHSDPSAQNPAAAGR